MQIPSSIVRLRNHNKRLFTWITIYSCIFFGFLGVIYWQARSVNTYDFPAGQIQLSVSKEKYTAGDPITYTLTNGLVNDINLVSNCPQEPFQTYQWESGQWVRIHDTSDPSACKAIPKLTTVLPGHSTAGTFANWPKLFSKPGIYRIVAFADNYTALPYADFQVVAPPVAAASPQIIYKPVYTTVYTPIYVQTPAPTTTTTTTTTTTGGNNNTDN